MYIGFRKDEIGCGDHVWIKDRQPGVWVERASVVHGDECLSALDKRFDLLVAHRKLELVEELGALLGD